MKAVFDIRPHLKYSSDLCRRFSFQARSDHREVAHACVDDWIIFRETKAGEGRSAYIAVAFVVSAQPDPAAASFYSVTLDHFLLFTFPVPTAVDGVYFETQLARANRAHQAGATMQGRAMRGLFDADFDKIIRTGLSMTSDMPFLNQERPRPDLGLAEAYSAMDSDLELHSIDRMLVNRHFRHRTFRKHVGRAYDFTCAFTGLRCTDGRGHFEADGAHIRSVPEHGPDIVQNGLCASKTAHWLFDNYVFTLNPDFTLRMVPGLVDPAYLALLVPEGRPIHLPKDERLWPHARFVEHHRAEFLRRRG